ncbi:hypothetical protein SVAN01_10984 [Stagonosporopsis vannaccii]|nr:hypothetical protein SVAN01_10984 [Stagonosporopsis vannaccii]
MCIRTSLTKNVYAECKMFARSVAMLKRREITKTMAPRFQDLTLPPTHACDSDIIAWPSAAGKSDEVVSSVRGATISCSKPAGASKAGSLEPRRIQGEALHYRLLTVRRTTDKPRDVAESSATSLRMHAQHPQRAP